jgi:hypothetical protein
MWQGNQKGRMNKKVFFVVLSLTLAGASHAQLRKCVGPDGRVTFSDVACSSNAKSTEVISAKPSMQGYEASAAAPQRRAYEPSEGPRSSPVSNYERELTGKIAGHLANGDIGTAASLATTTEHLNMVAEAKREKTRSDLAYDRNERANEDARRRNLPTVCKSTSQRDGYGPGSRFTSTTKCGKEGD